MVDIPATRFTPDPQGHIAYQVMGEGPPDIVLIESWGNSIDLQWELSLYERYIRRLASCGRLIRFDKRGEGASDPVSSPYEPITLTWIEESAADAQTVMDRVGSDRAVIVGTAAGACPAMIFSATRPDRVLGLVLTDPILRIPAPDQDHGLTKEMADLFADGVRRYWGSGETSLFVGSPSRFDDRDLRRWFGRYERLAMSRGVMARAWENMDYDLRPLLPLIHAPTRVFAHEGTPATPDGALADLSEGIPHAICHRIPTADTGMWAEQPAWVFEELEAFIRKVGGTDRPPPAERIFAVVLFTDLVESTRQLVEAGDRRWKELLDVHDSVADREIKRAGGRLINRTGDGVLATFEAPARAVGCARSVGQQVARLGMQVRAGLHAGEVELRGSDVGGIAVHIASRVMNEAAPGEVLVSRTIRDLVAGSGLVFEDRGSHTLKGVPEDWQLYAVAN